jgi:hypothetical protein
VIIFPTKWHPDADAVVPTPVGAECMRCDEPIKEGDRGWVFPVMRFLETDPDQVVAHRHCFLLSLGIGAVP